MHELGIVAAAVRQAAGSLTAPAEGAELRIAPSVDPAVAREAFTAAAAGTLLQAATLRVEIVQNELACLDCASHYPGTTVTPCPACGGDGLIIASPPQAEVVICEAAR